MGRIIVECQRTSPEKAVQENGWCSGNRTSAIIGLIKEGIVIESEPCEFRENCRLSIITRSNRWKNYDLIQLDLFSFDQTPS